ncbi:MAG TPA: PH domain-containing protein [Candidatus Saccharimonadales bacterium]|nr:PH domain-containing protein [Candidatus Saccharimonadales bacterium]
MSEHGDFQPDFPGQHPDEKVTYVFRQHPIVMRKQLIYGLLAIVVAEVPLLVLPPSAFDLCLKIFLAAIAVVIAFWFYTWIGWHYSIYIVTDRRLIDIRQKGFFNRKVSEVGFDKIQSINYHIKGFQAAVLKFGDITVQTYTSDWVLKSVSHPVEAHTRLMDVARVTTSTPPSK